MSGDVQEWALVAPLDVGWTPEEMAQVGRAVEALRDALPGRDTLVRIDGLQAIMRTEPPRNMFGRAADGIGP